jgi:hypothetical protein
MQTIFVEPVFRQTRALLDAFDALNPAQEGLRNVDKIHDTIKQKCRGWFALAYPARPYLKLPGCFKEGQTKLGFPTGII